jgi:hypothetical protein
MSDSSKNAEKKVNEGIDKASDVAKDEVTKLRNELNELRRKAGPKVQEAENFLTSPPVLGFIEGIVCYVSERSSGLNII